MKLWKHLFGIFLISTLIALAIVHAPITSDYSAENEGWNGISKLIKRLTSEKFEVIIARDLTNLKPAKDVALLILSPQIEYTASEIRVIQGIINQGGLLIVLDDFYKANELLARLKVPIRITLKPVLDEVFYSRNIIFPIAMGSGKTSFATLNMSLILNVPSSLNLTHSTEWSIIPLFMTSEYSFLDTNMNSEHENIEPSGPFLIAALAINRNKGKVIVISDPSIIINSMLDKGDNYKFLVKVLNGYNIKRIIIDNNHRFKEPIENLRMLIITASSRAILLLSDPLVGYATLITILLSIIAIAMRISEVGK